ncbi:uncharacterized protein LOC110826926 [Zootermopsis nevadensis]|uniref:Death domain-containing protein n=1 Tax=Zootermopsis nevadensis TaxID=136037 RepID=A0A067RP46_ZOONE|nr:uncharacterized protein LOC110826926 [Zootermopsis nevadensis]KDR22395.1 hypothetical protein L798_02486 [Zootermopsis nevadensis]
MNNRKARNPELEAMRKTAKEKAVESLPNLEHRIAELQTKTSRLHSAFLFDDSHGLMTLQMLCRCLSSTRNSLNFAGWEEFGIHLGLNPLVIECIKHSFTSQDPTYYILLAFVQHEDATLNKVVDALKEMGRLDVINRTINLMSGLADDVMGSHTNNEESGYFSISDGHSDSLSDTEVSNRSSIIRPLSIPSAPFIFREIVSQRFISQPHTAIQTGNFEEENYQTAVAIRSRPTVQYACKVLLTFASDGLDTAQQIAREFRKKRENLLHIGVVILNEHSDLVNNNPEQFISACFHQVDYVVPIITENYLKAIATRDNRIDSSMLCMDPKYVKYIYTLMSTYYLRNGCINDKIRCVVPDSSVHLTQNHPVMIRPLFQVWVRASEVEQLSCRLLQYRF